MLRAVVFALLSAQAAPHCVQLDQVPPRAAFLRRAVRGRTLWRSLLSASAYNLRMLRFHNSILQQQQPSSFFARLRLPMRTNSNCVSRFRIGPDQEHIAVFRSAIFKPLLKPLLGAILRV